MIPPWLAALENKNRQLYLTFPSPLTRHRSLRCPFLLLRTQPPDPVLNKSIIYTHVASPCELLNYLTAGFLPSLFLSIPEWRSSPPLHDTKKPTTTLYTTNVTLYESFSRTLTIKRKKPHLSDLEFKRKKKRYINKKKQWKYTSCGWAWKKTAMSSFASLLTLHVQCVGVIRPLLVT